MDGVLVDSSDAHFHAWARLGDLCGTPYSRDLFDRTFGMHNRQIIPIWLGDNIAPGEIARLSDLKERMYREVAAGRLRPLPGAVQLVRALVSHGFVLAVGSSGPRANVELALDLLGVGDLFSALSTGDETREGKPHPAVFLKAVELLGLPASQCVVIEDAPQGVAAGFAAGTRVVAVTSTRDAAALAGADLVVNSLEALSPNRLRALLL